MSTATECPALESWQALFEDALPPETRRTYEHHLDACPVCQERLDHAEGCGESLRNLVRRAADPTITSAEPTLVQVLERLHESSTTLVEADPANDLYFLTPADKPDLLGMLGEYEVQEVLGRGGMGIVLKAFDPALHRLVAIKVLSPTLAGSLTARLRFTREAQAAAAVSHDHVVVVHGVYEIASLPYFVMEYIAGESLQERIDREGPLDLKEIVRISLQTASGLAAAHAQGLIHRDIKPANLLLENGVARVTITDFGLARTADEVHLTQHGVVAGTPEYMAPEQACGDAIDHRADLFSLGSVLYAMCTGAPPFHGSTTLAVLRQVSDATPTPIRALNPATPPWLEQLIERLLAKNPEERLQTAAEVADLLEGFLAHLQQPATIASPELPHGPRSSPSAGLGRSRSSLWLGLALLLLLAAGGVTLLLQGGAPEQKAPPAGNPLPIKEGRLTCDFREPLDRFPFLSPYGPQTDLVMKTDPLGLRATLPAERGNTSPVGLETALRLRGNFEITLGYELLSLGQPAPEYGEGIVLRVWLAEPIAPSAMVSRKKTPQGDFFGAHQTIRGADNKDTYTKNGQAKAMSSRGKLRLLRTGTKLQYLAAEEGLPFKPIMTTEISTADVRVMKLEYTTMYKPISLDARLTDFVVSADSFPDGQPTARHAAVPDLWTGERSGSGFSLIVVLILGTAILLAAVAFLVWRRARRVSENPARAGSRLTVGKRRLVYLGLGVLAMAVAGLGLALGLGGGGDAQAPAANSICRQDLRGQKVNEEVFRITSDTHRELMTVEPQGLRVTIPPQKQGQGAIGLMYPSHIQGDCDIMFSYELLNVDDPAQGWAAGASIWFMTATGTQEAVLIGNLHKPGGQFFACQRMTKDAAGKRVYDTLEPVEPTRVKAGRLRLVRRGTTVKYLVAEDDKPEFRELHKTELGPEEITLVKFGAESARAGSPVVVRFRELEIRALQFPLADPQQERSELRTASRVVLFVLPGVGLLTAVAFIGRVVLGRGGKPQHKPAGPPNLPAPADAVLPISFACPACGKSLRARRALGGKKVKCPKCGQPALVPDAGAGTETALASSAHDERIKASGEPS
jgi:serine/threonine-protein kinase